MKIAKDLVKIPFFNDVSRALCLAFLCELEILLINYYALGRQICWG